MRHLLVPLAVLALVAGCTPDVAPTGSPSVFPSPTVSASASPTPSPSPSAVESFPPAPATESPEQAAIRAAWMEYWRVYEKFAADPSLSDLTETQQVTTGEAQNVILDAIGQLRDDNTAFLGGWQFRDVIVAVPSDGGSGEPTSELTYCVDRSRMRLENTETGVVSEQSLPSLRETALMKQGKDGRWRLAERRNQEEAC